MRKKAVSGSSPSLRCLSDDCDR